MCFVCHIKSCSFVITHFGNAESFKVVIERDGGERFGKLCHVIYMTQIWVIFFCLNTLGLRICVTRCNFILVDSVVKIRHLRRLKTFPFYIFLCVS